MIMIRSEEKRDAHISGGDNLGAYYVRALFERHRVEKPFQVLEELFELSYSTARRRLMGEFAWPLEDLKKVANKFGESLAEMITNMDGDGGEPGTFEIGEVRKSCRVWVGSPLTEITLKDFVATKFGDSLKVTLGGNPGGDTYAVRRFLVESAYRIAVLDDERDIAESIKEDLIKVGFFAESFTSMKRLTEKLKYDAYDGYLLDWIIHGVKVLDLAKMIRAQDKNAFIGILTGKFATGEANADEIIDACETLDMERYTKPAPMSFVISTITRKLRG